MGHFYLVISVSLSAKSPTQNVRHCKSRSRILRRISVLPAPPCSSAQGQYEIAEPLYRRATRIDENALGVNHPRVARDLSNWAELLQAQVNSSTAAARLRRQIIS